MTVIFQSFREGQCRSPESAPVARDQQHRRIGVTETWPLFLFSIPAKQSPGLKPSQHRAWWEIHSHRPPLLAGYQPASLEAILYEGSHGANMQPLQGFSGCAISQNEAFAWYAQNPMDSERYLFSPAGVLRDAMVSQWAERYRDAAGSLLETCELAPVR